MARNQVNLFVVLVLTLSVFIFNNNLDEPWWTDESRHLMDGVFIADFLRDLPIPRVMNYAEEYFARYPALGFTWYLPFFAFVEGIFFLVLGISIFSGKATMLTFLVVANVSIYVIFKRIYSPTIALVTVSLMMIHPNFVIWARSIMLEIPSLAMMCIFWVAVHWYFSSPNFFRSFVAGFAGFCMLMTKQTTMFIFIPLLIYIMLFYDWRWIFSLKSVPALLLIGIGFAGTATHALLFGASAIDHIEGYGTGFFSRLIEKGSEATVNAVFKTYGVFVLATALAGVIACIKSGHVRELMVTAGWLLGGVIFFAAIGTIEGNIARWSILVSPAIFALCACILLVEFKSRLYRLAVYSILVAIAINVGHKTATAKHPKLQGFEEIANYVHERGSQRPILFCCRHEGNFIFFYRTLDQDRNAVILRADKMLVSIVISKERGIVEHTSTEQEIMDLIYRSGVEIVVLEEGTLSDVTQFELLRSLVKTEKFEHLETFRIRSTGTSFNGLPVGIYRLISPPPLASKEIIIPFPHLGRDIRLKLFD